MTTLAPPLQGPLPRPRRRLKPVLRWKQEDPRAVRDAALGTALSLAYAAVLGLARIIDVSEDGKAMMAFSLLYLPALLYASWARPLWFLLLAVAFMPFSKVYPLSLAGVTGANMSNVILLLAPLAAARGRARPPLSVGWGAVEWWILLFLVAGSASALTALPQADGMGALLQTYRGWLAPILFFFIARSLVRTRAGLLAALRCVAAMAILVGALTWIEGIQRGNRGSIEASRVEGLMGQANQMGAFLVYYGTVTLTLAFSERRVRARLLFLGGFLVTARAVLFTFSRAAYLALGSGTSLAILLQSPLLLVAGGALGVGAVAVNPSLIPSSIRERFDQTSEGAGLEGENEQLDKSSAYRLILWKAAFRMIQENPVSGVGLGRFSQVVGSYTDVQLSKNDPNDAHNAYLLVAAEMGLPGALAMVGLLLALAFTGLRVHFRRGPPADRAVALALMGCWGGVLVSCALGSRFGDESLISLFWILAGLLVVARRLGDPRQKARA